MRINRSVLIASLFLSFLSTSSATLRYVDANSASPAPPYTSWPTAARVIQDAVEVSADGDLILVTNGAYQTGGQAIAGETTGNRVALTKAVVLQSVNGPAVTLIRGYQVPGTTNGPGAVRCAYLTNGASLLGFTLTNGATAATNSQSDLHGPFEIGGGAACRSWDAVVSNCIVVGNFSYQGGGAAHGTWINCTFSNNAAVAGGGAYNGGFYNCLFVGNRADVGGGAFLVRELSAMANCTIAANTAAEYGGGVWVDSMIETGTLLTPNCIIYGNTAPNGSNWVTASLTKIGAINDCIAPLPLSQLSSFTLDPLFKDPVNGDFRLQSNSPCINAGTTNSILYVPTTFDLAGNPRISGGTIDIGAYEFQNPSSILSYAWAQSFGLPTDGSADFADPDADGMSNWQEWQAGTDPTNSASVLKMLAVVPTNNASQMIITWQSVPTITYVLQCTTNLASPFVTLNSNIPGYSGPQGFVATNPHPQSPVFYRVGVR